MKNFMVLLVAGGLFYLAVRMGLFYARRAGVARLTKEIGALHATLIRRSREELERVSGDFSKWKSGDRIQHLLVSSEEEFEKRIAYAQSELQHQEAVHEKYLRLTVRFSAIPKKLAESIVAYHNYLSVKMDQYRDAEMHVRALEADAITLEDLSESARETKILVEESERRLDVLLSSG